MNQYSRAGFKRGVFAAMHPEKSAGVMYWLLQGQYNTMVIKSMLYFQRKIWSAVIYSGKILLQVHLHKKFFHYKSA